MRHSQFIAKTYALAAVLLLPPADVWAELTVNVDTTFYSRYPYIRFVGSDDPMAMSDETFYAVAAKIGFAINETEPLAGDKLLAELKKSVLPRINADSLELIYMVVRGTASPDGSYVKNKVRGEKRAQWLFNFIRKQLQFPVNEDKFRMDSQAEDYRTLCLLMRQAGDKDYRYVKDLCDRYLPTDDIVSLKTTLHSAQNGLLWKRLLKTYFPQLRTARVVLYFKKYEGEKLEITPAAPPVPTAEPTPVIPEVLPPAPVPQVVLPPEPTPTEPAPTLCRRELLALKTNLLFYGAYIPGYDRWCPIPNVAVEYYPKKGHFTFGASFDMPWWQDYDAHKFFQLRNYQLETRYYLRKSPASEPAPAATQEKRTPAFSGFYLQAYANGGIFGICFDANRGWVGEGFGGGLGLGYVVPLSRNGHWRLDFGLQVGYFTCKYDPYQFENPVDPTYHDNLYYYKWKLEPSLFKKRQYRWEWIGPTRLGITLSYDLLYRRILKKGMSFRPYENNEVYTPQEERRAEP